MVIGGTNGVVHYFLGSSSGLVKNIEGLKLTDGTSISFKGVTVKPILFDYNNDGLIDLAFANSLTGIKYEKRPVTVYINAGTQKEPLFKSPFEIPGITGIKPSAAFGDVDGDGYFDLIVGSYFSFKSTLFYKNTGDNENPKFSTKGVKVSFKGIPITERFLKTHDYLDKKDEAKALLETEEYWSWVGKAVTNVALSDYNNDGKMDLIVGVLGLTTPTTWADMPFHGSMLFAFSNDNNGVSNFNSKIENGKNKIQLTQHNQLLSILNIPHNGVYTIRVYSPLGCLLYSKLCTVTNNTVEIKLGNNTYASGMKIIEIPEVGFRQTVFVR